MKLTPLIRSFPSLALLAVLGTGLGACGNNGAIPGKGVNDTVQSFQDGLDAVGDGLDAILADDAAMLRNLKTATFDQAFTCTSGGSGTVTGTGEGDAAAGTFDLTMNLQGCNGMTGSIGFSGDYADDGSSLTVDLDFGTGSSTANDTLSSSLGCSVFFRDTQLFTETTPDDPEPFGTVFSAFRGSCVEPGGNVITDCSWDNLDFNDSDLLAQNCICNGQGC